MKYIIVVGGVISGVGKGIVTSSIGALLGACNLRVTAIKIDPYLNTNAGLFSPYEHGEVFVLNDGSEVDLDLGNYERFLDINLSANHNITTGKIHKVLFAREETGSCGTIQIIPTMTDAIQQWIERTAGAEVSKDLEKHDICIIELGGTVGDIEGMAHMKALRKLKRDIPKEDFLVCLVAPVIQWGPGGEFKTKPIQRSLTDSDSFGISPDIVICRCREPFPADIKRKILQFSDLQESDILTLADLKSVYQVPAELEKQNILKIISEHLKINACPCNRLQKWIDLSSIAINAPNEVTIALVGKYTKFSDSYMSVIKALEHACYDIETRPKILFIESTSLENGDEAAWNKLKSSDCLIVPGGFGSRGIEGKIAAIKWARENKFPFLGICLGFQMAVVEYARNVLDIPQAHSVEFISEGNNGNLKIEPVVIEMLEYLDPNRSMLGTMRLGLRKTVFVVKDSILKKKYNNLEIVEERHRHRYEINKDYISRIEEAGMKFVGRNEQGDRMEILELSPEKHPYFVAVQYHPEYLSRPFKPSPPYKGLIEAGRQRRQNNVDL